MSTLPAERTAARLMRNGAIAWMILLFGVVDASADPRSYQHGVDFVPGPGGLWWLIWSSSGNPPTGPDTHGSWPHDVYVALVNPEKPTIRPRLFIERPEAQEPASAAATADGNIMITFEDGWNAAHVLAQRYGVYDHTLNPVRPYPEDVFDGGHSGHVAATDDKFVVFYSEEWVDGGGVDDLGSGDDVHVSVYDSSGTYLYANRLAVGDASRDWWPLVAGSKSVACLVWQRFVPGKTYATLMAAQIDVDSGSLISPPRAVMEEIAYYTYSVAWLPELERFLLLGAFHEGGGFGILMDASGKVITTERNLPPIVRESQSIIREAAGQTTVVQPVSPSGVAVFDVKSARIGHLRTLEDDYRWTFSGSDGIFLGEDEVFVVTLSPEGLVERRYRISGAGEERRPDGG